MRSVTKRDLITPSSDDAASASRNIHIEHIYHSNKKKKKQKIGKYKKKGGRAWRRKPTGRGVILDD